MKQAEYLEERFIFNGNELECDEHYYLYNEQFNQSITYMLDDNTIWYKYNDTEKSITFDEMLIIIKFWEELK